MSSSLSSDEDLKRACLSVEEDRTRSPRHQEWLARLGAHLCLVRDASYEEFSSISFQRQLWNSEAVSGVGWGGAINVDRVIADPAVVARLWALRNDPLPPSRYERTHYLAQAFKELVSLIEPHVEKIPRLKLFNVFAALHPTEFVTISFAKALRSLASEMGLPASGKIHPVAIHRSVLDRLEEVLGRVEPPPAREGLERMTLAWLLHSRVDDPNILAILDLLVPAGDDVLEPLPAARRRRGMLAIAGSFATVRGIVEFVKDGCVREDLREHIRSINPSLSQPAVNTNINAMIGEWGVLQADGDQLKLTPRGESLLESGDPDDVSDWLLTRILGFDHLLYTLKNNTAATRADLRTVLKTANPGWTSNFTPDAMIDWQRDLGLIRREGSHFTLTEEGRNWARRIRWHPENLSPPPEEDPVAPALAETNDALRRPGLTAMLSAFPSGAVFPDKLVAKLDASLWSNPRRHFAVLAGLSGSGKTLLACSYARALWHDQDDPRHCLYTLPVQPGWHDPASVFGYVNPLNGDNYVRTGFLEFLLRAAVDPSRPYTVVLDEMNLSHPEQYLAPLLSAMETGDEIELHTFAEDIGGVPPRLAYPDNLVVIGTVNMDETTHGLSDKILDRAAVLEFWDVDVDAFPGWRTTRLPDDVVTRVRAVLSALYSALRPVRLHFGWRTIGDIAGFVEVAVEAGVLDAVDSLDQAVFSKILPKLRGEDTKRLRDALDQVHVVLVDAQLMESAAKVADLVADLRHLGSARFWR